MPAPEIREAHPTEYAEIGELTASTYLAEGFCGPEYAVTLRDVSARAEHATILVAVVDGRIAGSVTVAHGGPYSEGTDPGTAVIRMLVTSAAFRGAGVGTALVLAAIEHGRQEGCSVVRLSTGPAMVAAHRVYERLGFTRTPERDWWPEPDVELLTYELPLGVCQHCGQPGEHAECVRALTLEPPRYCASCGRRMVVQVHPTGWSARCVEHGLISS